MLFNICVNCIKINNFRSSNKVGKEKMSKSSTTSTKSTANGQRVERIQRRKTKSCPSCPLSNNTEEKCEVSKSDTPRTVSVFGKYNGKESEYKPTVWFNLPQEQALVSSIHLHAMQRTKSLCVTLLMLKKAKVCQIF
ncbi:hypothetical protein OS493_023236 [Desmophyllum pertusum]|uniref:Uncharacterized protein n=1 Tax=Desmophyllum pertusum TaxID=174260 RepID=A0A9W9YM52_9CNID|nr:hypothetical protein OS493_023236 [Desmophyllum pertusum]